MSLLDDVSIVVTPNGYKAGTLYGVLPTATEGSELVTSWTNNDFASFASSGSNITQMVSSGSGNNNYSAVTITSGKIYKLKFTSSQAITCQIRISANTNLTGASVVLNSLVSGTNEIEFTAPSTYAYIGFYAPGSFTDTQITNFTLKEQTKSDMVVTRATAATRVDENGLVNYAQVVSNTDLVTDGDFPTGTSNWTHFAQWNITNDKANFLDSSNGVIYQSISLGNNKTYKLDFTISSSSNNAQLLFANSNGSVVYFGSGYQSYNDGNHTLYFTMSSDQTTFGVYGSTSGNSFSIDNIILKEVDRNNVPRIDYTGGGCPHILAEPQRTNLITYSEDFSNAAWSKTSGGTGSVPVITSNNVISPDGTQNATRIVFDAGSGTSNSNKSEISSNVTASDNTNATASIYLKGLNGGEQLVFRGVSSSTYTLITLTTEWQRFSTTENSGTSNDFIQFGIRQSVSGHGVINANPTIFAWGAQIEEGSYPTSYIPTSGSSVTRNADVFSRDGISSLINSTEGVLFIEMARQNADTAARVISLSNGTATQNVSLYYFSTGQIAFDVISSSPVVTGNSASHNTYNFNKIAIKYKSGDIALWVNGVEVVTKTNTISLSGLNKISFGYGNDTFPFFGKIKQLQVYKTALTDAQLTSLTS